MIFNPWIFGRTKMFSVFLLLFNFLCVKIDKSQIWKWQKQYNCKYIASSARLLFIASINISSFIRCQTHEKWNLITEINRHNFWNVQHWPSIKYKSIPVLLAEWKEGTKLGPARGSLIFFLYLYISFYKFLSLILFGVLNGFENYLIQIKIPHLENEKQMHGKNYLS